MIPAAMIKLDKPHPALGQSPGEQTVAGKGAIARLATIEVQRLGGFAGNVHQARYTGLHLEGHLVLRDARGDFRIARQWRLQIVERLHGVDHIALSIGIHAARPAYIHPGIAGGPQLNALKLARQKSCVPHAHGDRLRTASRVRAKHDEPRQILRLTTQPILDPRAHARPAADGGAGVHERVGGIMIYGVGVHRADHREVINMLGQMRKERGHLRAALAKSLRGKLRPQAGELLILQLRDRLALGKRRGHRLPVHFHQLRLVGIERLQVRRPTGHVQIDYPLHLGRMMQRPHHARPTLHLAPGASRRQSGHRHRAEAHS